VAIFQINKEKAKKLSPLGFGKEKTLQNLFESNLSEFLNLRFIATEYSTSFGGRIDTLAIDAENAPVIIEYKKSQNDNVINQGLSYLRWLLDHKAEFEKACAARGIKGDVDWEFPRVICISEAYSRFDLDTADMLPIKVELFRHSLYEGGLFVFEPVAYLKGEGDSIRRGIRGGSKSKAKLQTTYLLEDHLKKADKENVRLFMALREEIKSIDEGIIEEPRKLYVAYKKATNFVDIVILKKSLLLFLNIESGQLNDPQKLARDLRNPEEIGHWGNGDYSIKIKSEEDVKNAMRLILQSYQKNK
jgi:predicted transport protein